MDQAKVSTSENNVDELVGKNEFPKLKTSKPTSFHEHLERESSEQHVQRLGVSFWAPMVLFLAQVILFVLTFRLVKVFHDDYQHRETAIAANKDDKPLSQVRFDDESAPIELHRIPSSVLKEESKPLKPNRFLLSDFNREALITHAGSPIFVNSDKLSQKALKVSLDGERRYGKNGSSLRVEYLLTSADELPAIINIDASNIEISAYHKLTFRLMIIPTSEQMPKLEVRLMSSMGNSEKFLVTPLFSFWKKYEYDLTGLIQKNISAQLQAIQFVVYPAERLVKGSWFIDDIALE